MACQEGIRVSRGVGNDCVCVFLGPVMHRENEAKDSERNEHFGGGGTEVQGLRDRGTGD
jgi:hypothetical protein